MDRLLTINEVILVVNLGHIQVNCKEPESPRESGRIKGITTIPEYSKLSFNSRYFSVETSTTNRGPNAVSVVCLSLGLGRLPLPSYCASYSTFFTVHPTLGATIQTMDI